MRVLLMILTILLSSHAVAAQDIYEFKNDQDKNRFYQLASQFRCLVCQNQTLADSNAPLALDLRDHVYEQVKEGMSNKQITEYLVSRYGEFILYNPEFIVRNYVLWLLPMFLLIIGMGSMVFYVKNQAKIRNS